MREELFKNENGSPAINPVFAVAVSLSAILLLWLIGRKGLEALKLKPVQSLDRLIGLIGESQTEIHNDGTVYVGGEQWSARSEKVIKEGTQVQVVKREGLVLIVEPYKPKKSSD